MDENGTAYMYHLQDVKTGPLGRFLPPGSHFAVVNATAPKIIQAQITSKESLEAFSQQIVQSKELGTDCIKQLSLIGQIKTEQELANSISVIMGYPIQPFTAGNWLRKAFSFICSELKNHEEIRSIFNSI